MNKTLKSLLLCAFALVPMLGANAQTADDAEQAARQLLMRKTGKSNVVLKSVDMRAAAATMKKAKLADVDLSGIHGFNAEGGGFALVCSSNGKSVVAGYSDKGEIDIQNMPDAMRSLLVHYSRAMKNASADGQRENSWDGPTVAPVAPMIKTQWGIGEPFNGMCPSDGKQTALTGSNAVALAQVLNFYRSEKKGVGSIYYAHRETETEYDIDYSTTSYDWANMLDSYNGDYTQTQADAVAKLIVEAGIACKTEYGFSSMSSYNPYVALNKYYNFDCNVIQRTLYQYSEGNGGFVKAPQKILNYTQYYVDVEKWMSVVQKELSAGRPIICSGRDTDLRILYYSDQGHCFVIDGIDSENFVHVNWGYYGLDDGYYDMTFLNPPFYDGNYKDNNNGNYEGGYGYDQTMITNIKPRTGDYEEVITPVFQQYDDYGFNLTTNTYDAKEFGLAVTLVQNGEIRRIMSAYKVRTSGFPNTVAGVLGNGFKDSDAFTGLDDGTYYIMLAYRDAESTGTYTLCPAQQELLATVTLSDNGKTVVYDGRCTNDAEKKTVVSSIEPASRIYASTPFYLKFKGKIFGAKSGAYNLIFENVETKKKYGSYENGSSRLSPKVMYAGLKFTWTGSFMPRNDVNGFTMPAGTYRIYSEDEELVLPENAMITVEPKSEMPVLDNDGEVNLRGKSKIVKDDQINSIAYEVYSEPERFDCDFSLANNVEGKVTMKMYAIDANTGEEVFLGTIKDYDATNNFREIYMPNRLYPLTGPFYLKVRCYNSAGELASIYPEEIFKPSYEYVVNYNINGGNSVYKLDLMDAVGVAGGDNSQVGALKVSLYNFTEYDFKGLVKAVFYDDDMNELASSEVSDVEINGDATVDVTFTPELEKDKTYIVRVLTKGKSDSDYRYQYASAGINKIAEIYFNPSDISGIGTVEVDRLAQFKDGDVLYVYSVDSRLVCKTVASGGVREQLRNSLKPGIYIVKSGAKSIKVRL